MKRKILALLVAATMLLSLTPMTAFASTIDPIRPADLPETAIELDAIFTNSNSGNNALRAIWQDVNGVYVLVDRNSSTPLNNSSKLNDVTFELVKTYSQYGIEGLESIKKDNVFDLIVFKGVVVVENNKLELWCGNGTGNSVISGTELKVVGLVKVTYYEVQESNVAIDLDVKQVFENDPASFVIKGIGETERAGYIFSHWVDKDDTKYYPDNPITITKNLDLYAVWTPRTDLGYEVNYLEQGTNAVLAPQKAVDSQTFDADVTEDAIDIVGYNKVEPISAIIIISEEDNVINFYYTARTDLSYEVNYLEQGTNEVLATQKVVEDQVYGTSVTENAIDIVGYNKVAPTSVTITIAVSGNVINFYYTARTDLGYEVNYLEQGTGKVLAAQKTVGGQTFGTDVTENAIDIAGYNKVAPTSAIITIEETGNEINFYYTARTDLSYVVNYLEQGTNKILATQKAVGSQTFGTDVTEDAIDIAGYNKVAPTSTTITIEETGNEINFYYTARTDLSYVVNYLEQGTDKVLATQKVVAGQTFDTEVTENAIDIVGYNKVAPTSVTITIAVEGNVINFYYTARTDLSYVVNYLEQGTNKILATQKAVGSQTFGTNVTENAIDIAGYNKVAPTSTTITIAVTGNVIDFFYTARTDLSYVVNYLEEGTNAVLADQKVVNGQTFKTDVTENAIDITGYNKVAPTSVTITIAVEDNVVNFYYTARTDLSYVVNYLEQDTNAVLADQKVVSDQTFGTDVTENAIVIKGYNKEDPTSATITIAVEGNVINFYYTIMTDLSYTVEYLEAGTNVVLADSETIEPVTFNETYTEYAKEVISHNVDMEIKTIKITEEKGNVLVFYYTIKTFTVTFVDYDDSILKVQEDVPWGSAAEAPADDPTRLPLYRFIGWSPDFSFITEDLTVTALYERIGENEDGDNNVFDPGGGNGNGYGGGSNGQGSGGNGSDPGTGTGTSTGGNGSGGNQGDQGNQGSSQSSSKATVSTSVKGSNVTITVKYGTAVYTQVEVIVKNTTQTYDVYGYNVQVEFNNGGQVKSAKIVN